MKFEPKSEETIQRERCLPAGVYDFEVLDASEGPSKSGNQMITLQLRVFSDDGQRVQMRDWLLSAIAHKLRHFCASCGILDLYEAGTLTSDDCKGQSGKVKVVIKEDTGYGPQNSVADYVVEEKTSSGKIEGVGTPQSRKVAADMDGDDIPF